MDKASFTERRGTTSHSRSSAPRLEGLESHSLGLPSGNIFGIASNGEMALALGWRHTLNWMGMGTLGEGPLSGGAPRPLLEKVCAGDISQDGKQFAIARCAGTEQTLEFPMESLSWRVIASRSSSSTQ